ncbi:MAG: hypothetical protein BWX70_03004 [Verrucomicrobia bacterium ADurb.Bin070]|nr:MAG: hypothetical protein BWX70_03004 [Verrucomicrobia bacterium ADurb.Bin070]
MPPGFSGAFAVDEHLVFVVRRERQQHRCVLRAARGFEHLAEMADARRRLRQRRGVTGPDPLRAGQIAVRARGGICADPAGVPVARTHHTHDPASRRTPGGWRVALVVPGAHLPIAALRGRERRAGVNHIQRLVGDHAAAVPEVALVVTQPLRRGGHQNLVGGLAQAARRTACGSQLPAQARGRMVKPHWIVQIIDCQGLRGGERAALAP